MEKKKLKSETKTRSNKTTEAKIKAPKKLKVAVNSRDLSISEAKSQDLVKREDMERIWVENKIQVVENKIQDKVGDIVANFAASEVFEKVALAGSQFERQQEEIRKMMEAFNNSPGIRIAKEAMDSLKKLQSIMVLPSIDLGSITEAFAASEELRKSVEALSNFGDFQCPELFSERLDYIGKGLNIKRESFLNPIIVEDRKESVKESVEKLGEGLKKEVDLIVQEKIDKLSEQGIIKKGSGERECYCIHCGAMVFKIKEISYFMEATHKCKCGETLQIPGDLNIIVPKKLNN